MIALDYRIILQPLPMSEGGGFVAWAPDLPGCLSDGATPEDALDNVRQAVGEWIEEARRIGRTVPAPTQHSVSA